MVRIYAQLLGLVLILVGLVGLLLGERLWLGVLNVDLFEDIVHLVTGGLLAFVGFSERGGEYARSVVGGLGLIYLLVGLLGFVVPTLLGLLPHGYSLALPRGESYQRVFSRLPLVPWVMLYPGQGSS
jgi:hypothetical protein